MEAKNKLGAQVEYTGDTSQLSYLAGVKQGRRDVVEWVREMGLGTLGSIYIPADVWEAKLKEWGL